MSGGLVTVGDTLSRGTYGTINLNSGGTLQIGTGTTGGVLGVSTLTNNGTLVFNRSNASTYSGVLSGSGAVTKQGGGTFTLAGVSSLSGPTTIKQGTLVIANAAALSASSITPLAGGTMSLSPRLVTSIGGLQPRAGGLVDVGSGLVTVAAGLSAVDAVAALISGRGDGAWTGTSGITSSTAAAEVAALVPRSVGWLDNGDGSLTVAYAAPGDTNLDWSIDILDAANFLALGKFDTGAAATWFEGDFGYDGIVDILDAADFVSTGLFDAGLYNTPPTSLTAGAVAVVPEPSTIAVALAGVVSGGYSMWRRRNRRGSFPGGTTAVTFHQFPNESRGVIDVLERGHDRRGIHRDSAGPQVVVGDVEHE